MQSKRLDTAAETVRLPPDVSPAHAPTMAAANPSTDETVLGNPTSMTVSSRARGFGTTLARPSVLPRVSTDEGAPSLVYEEAPRYEPLGALGQGGVGEVIKARDNDIGRVVAVKRLKPEMRAAAVPLARFVDEIRTVGRLEHPNIVPIHDVGVDEQGQHYFVMKYVNGETLETIIEKLAAGSPEYHARFTFEHRVQIFMGILEAVAFAHDAGFIHRDIKPANVMVGRFGEVMLMDWGIAKRIDKDGPPASIDLKHTLDARDATGSAMQTQAGALVGTPAYMSPEQALGQTDLDERSDVYSLSLLFWEFLTLEHPLTEKKTLQDVVRAAAEERVPFATFRRNPHQPPVPADLGWFVDKGLAKSRDERYPSVAAMIERLNKRADGIVPIQCPITFTKRMTSVWMRFVDRHPMLVTIGVGLVALAIPASIVLMLVRR